MQSLLQPRSIWELELVAHQHTRSIFNIFGGGPSFALLTPSTLTVNPKLWTASLISVPFIGYLGYIIKTAYLAGCYRPTSIVLWPQKIKFCLKTNAIICFQTFRKKNQDLDSLAYACRKSHTINAGNLKTSSRTAKQQPDMNMQLLQTGPSRFWLMSMVARAKCSIEYQERLEAFKPP